MSNEKENKEVIKIATLLAEAEKPDIPELLLRLKGLLEKCVPDSQDLRILRKTIWKYDLLSWCAIALKYDYLKIRGSFEAAVTIAEILCECCCNLDINDSQEFSQTTLPLAMQSCLRLLWQLQQRIHDKVKKSLFQFKTDAELLDELFHHLTSLITSHPYLCCGLLNSSDLLRLAMADDACSLRTIALVMRAFRVNRCSVSQLTQESLQSLMDEIVYKLTASENEEVAKASTRLIVAMCEAHNTLVPFIVTRYKGLKILLGKWNGRGFDRELSHLIAILDAGSAQAANSIRQKNAVITIWACYKGWKTRSQLKKFKRALPSLQQSFRKKRMERQEQEEEVKSAQIRDKELKLERRRSLRKQREKKLQSIEIVPAAKVPNFIQDEEHSAATRIQSSWRTHRQRKNFCAERELQRRVSAALVIQKQIRKVLKRRKSLKESLIRPVEEDLDEDRRNYLKEEIQRWQTIHKRDDVAREEAEQIHKMAQEKLVLHYRRKVFDARENQKIEGLLARIHTDQEILKHLPSLEGAGSKDIEELACNSALIQKAALAEHEKQSRLMTQPWWKQLNHDSDDVLLEGW